MSTHFHSGTTISELHELSEKVEAVHTLTGSQLSLEVPPLPNKDGRVKYPRNHGDTEAANLLADLQFCIESNQTKLCSVPGCGKMEGLHRHWGNTCPDYLDGYQGVRGLASRFVAFKDQRRA